MASRMREDPLIKIHSESSKEHHIEASTCLTMIFERVIKAVPPLLRPDLHTSYSLYLIILIILIILILSYHTPSNFIALAPIVGKFCRSLILKDCIKVQEKKKKVVVLCSRPGQNVKLGTFTL